ncbi:sensor histidine kinase [Lysobacter auxotrophicus]|uniref:histidine kinase n=1 Tax=Lysobacter auxotrophicus TaxID=2992573 RepID=A0ABM8DFJ3_9GAMM|nr:ATP-binding protein [Lysobacter auxotrophicus]BDU17376.1 ATP-binding protein [Lysobacter auxotrophicus]
MEPVTTRIQWGWWRLPLLAAGIVLIMVAPFLLLQRLSQQNLDAADAVSHTHEVEAAVASVALSVRDAESAAMGIALGLDRPLSRQRYAESKAAIGPNLDRLTVLTADNPEQQVLIGRLRELVDNRMDVMDDLMREGGRGDIARSTQILAPLVDRFAIRPALEEMRNNERELLARRNFDAERQRRQATWLSWAAMTAQLLLMGIVMLLLGRQIASRINAEKRSTQASARAMAVLQTVREPIVLFDEEQRIVMHNAAFAEMYDVPGDGLPKTLPDIGHGAWNDPVLRQRLRDVLLRGRELWDFELEQALPEGPTRTVLLNARSMPLPDAEDHVVLMTISDVSAQKATNQKIAELNRQLEGKVEQVSEVNRELEAFSYSVSHDLRAPLRHVAGFSDKLARHLDEDADEKTRHYLDVIGNSARRMSQLIDDLLVYSRLGRSALRLQAVDMQSVVAETRAMLDAGAEARAPRVEWRIAPLPILVADENMMRQLWTNLLGNAVKYSSRREVAIVEVTHRMLDDGSHEFSVRDNGAGFDMTYASKLFGVFQRMHKATDFPGTGIGLASVRRVLSRHGGRIWAESTPEVGSTFHFTLPAALDAPTYERISA